MELKSADFLINPDVVTAKRMRRRYKKYLLVTLRLLRMKWFIANLDAKFLLSECEIIENDPQATAREKEFANIVHEILTALEDIGKDNDE